MDLYPKTFPTCDSGTGCFFWLLHFFQYTIDGIGNAYDNLHEELKILAHVTEPKGKSRSIYTDKILSSPHPNHILAHSDSGKTSRNPQDTQISQTGNIIKDIYAQASFSGQEQFTNTDSKDRADKIVITPSIRDNLQNTEYLEKRDAKTYTANAINTGNSAKRPLASVKINTRNPLVSSAAGRGSSHNREIQTFAHCKQRDPNSNKIHQCRRDEIAVNN